MSSNSLFSVKDSCCNKDCVLAENFDKTYVILHIHTYISIYIFELYTHTQIMFVVCTIKSCVQLQFEAG